MLWIYTPREWLTSQQRMWQHIAQTKWHLSFKQTLVWAQQKSSLVFTSLCPWTKVCTCCNKVLGQNSFPWGSSRKYVFPDCLNIRVLLDSPECPICLPSLAHHAQSQHIQPCTRSRTQVLNYGWHTDTGIIHLSHLYIYTKSGFQQLSLFIPPRVHILSLDICSGVHDGPEHWCLTAATLNQDSVGDDTERAAREPPGVTLSRWVCLGPKCLSLIQKI